MASLQTKKYILYWMPTRKHHFNEVTIWKQLYALLLLPVRVATRLIKVHIKNTSIMFLSTSLMILTNPLSSKESPSRTFYNSIRVITHWWNCPPWKKIESNTIASYHLAQWLMWSCHLHSQLSFCNEYLGTNFILSTFNFKKQVLRQATMCWSQQHLPVSISFNE